MCWWLCPLSLSLSLSVAVCPSLSRFGRALLPFIFMFARCLGPPKNDDMKNCVARFWALLSDSVSLGVFFGGFSGVLSGVFRGSLAVPGIPTLPNSSVAALRPVSRQPGSFSSAIYGFLNRKKFNACLRRMNEQCAPKQISRFMFTLAVLILYFALVPSIIFLFVLSLSVQPRMFETW